MTDYTTKLRVLIVDDSDEVRSALSGIIESQPDLQLIGAASGVDEGVNLVRILCPDVVVLDVNMPGGGGQRAAREMRAADADLRIIAFSAFDKALIRKLMTIAGAVAYISKSADMRDLLAAIRGQQVPTHGELSYSS